MTLGENTEWNPEAAYYSFHTKPLRVMGRCETKHPLLYTGSHSFLPSQGEEAVTGGCVRVHYACIGVHIHTHVSFQLRN